MNRLPWIAMLVVVSVGTIACDRGRVVPQVTIDRAVQSLTAGQQTLDPILAIILDSVRRRFELAAVPPQQSYVDSAQATAHGAGTVMRTGDNLADMLAVFRRLMDPDARVTVAEVDALRMPIDQVTAIAIHCQALPPPADYLMTLDEMVALGGYAMTHAIIASQWLVENGCESPETIAVRHPRYVEALVQQIKKDDGTITDRRVEALATLFYIGEGKHAPQEWVDFVVQKQRPDGGWPAYADRTDASNPHTTLMALWLLLEARAESDRPRTPMVAQRAS
jgi:hypothetical protein